LILFRMMPRAIAKHVGILTGPDTFLHAYKRLGVIEQPRTPTWRRRIIHYAAQQTADWGAPLAPGQTLTIRIHQMSNRPGRGAPAAAILQF
jgi:hypothetical protein